MKRNGLMIGAVALALTLSACGQESGSGDSDRPVSTEPNDDDGATEPDPPKAPDGGNEPGNDGNGPTEPDPNTPVSNSAE